MTTDDIRLRIEAALPGARARVIDEADDGAHFVAEVTWAGFSGLSRVAQQSARPRVSVRSANRSVNFALSLRRVRAQSMTR